MSPPARAVNITYMCDDYGATLACYTRVHARNFRVPQSDDVLKQHALHAATFRLHKLFERASRMPAQRSVSERMTNNWDAMVADIDG